MRYLMLLLCLLLSLPSTAEQAQDNSVPLQELRLFSEVFHQIRSNYVQEVSDKQLLQYAIEGMLSNLDPHSTWLDQSAFASLQEMTQGEFAGIGVEVTLENDGLLVVAPIDDTPAEKGGILPGDKIIQIDNKNLKGLSMNECVELMRGKEGSQIQLSVLREGEKKPLVFKLKRALIKIDSVKSHLINQQYAYVRVSQFQQNSANDVKQQLNALHQAADKGLQGIVLDLRNNPGGLLDGAVALVNLFIQEGLIVYTQGRTDDSQERYQADGSAKFTTMPLVVLINSGSASASEIVAGALQDHKRALIMGRQSFGKGSVQTILPVPDNNAIKLTTALYYTPLGRSIQAEGITPDIELENVSFEPEKQTLIISEVNLAKHLDNKKSNKKAEVDNKSTVKESLKKDYALYEAVNILKAMSFAQEK